MRWPSRWECPSAPSTSPRVGSSPGSKPCSASFRKNEIEGRLFHDQVVRMPRVRIDLQAMIGGTLPEPDQTDVARHLDDCEACQHALERLAAGESPFAITARQLAEAGRSESPEDRSVVRGLVSQFRDRLRGEDPPERSTATRASRTTPGSTSSRRRRGRASWARLPSMRCSSWSAREGWGWCSRRSTRP